MEQQDQNTQTKSGSKLLNFLLYSGILLGSFVILKPVLDHTIDISELKKREITAHNPLKNLQEKLQQKPQDTQAVRKLKKELNRQRAVIRVFQKAFVQARTGKVYHLAIIVKNLKSENLASESTDLLISQLSEFVEKSEVPFAKAQNRLEISKLNEQCIAELAAIGQVFTETTLKEIHQQKNRVPTA